MPIEILVGIFLFLIDIIFFALGCLYRKNYIKKKNNK